MNNIEKWPNIILKSCGVNIKHESVETLYLNFKADRLDKHTSVFLLFLDDLQGNRS